MRRKIINILKNEEINFVCNQNSKRYYIQSAYALPTQSKTNQELRLLLNINGFLKIIIVREDIKPYYTEQGIILMGIRYFLLNDNNLEF